MDNVDGPKRTLPTPAPPSAFKRAKVDSPSPLPLSAPHGVERIRLLDVRRLSSQYLEQLAGERTATLRGQGRSVVGLPLVLDDGIILNWVRHKSGTPLVRRTTTLSVEHKNEEPRSGKASGASVADAIIIDSDEDISAVSFHSCTVPPVNGGTPLSRDVTDRSDRSPHSKNNAENNQNPSNFPLIRESLEGVAEPSNTPPLTTESVTLHSDDTSATTSDSDADGTGEVVNKAEDVNGGPKLPLPSFRSTKGSLGQRKRPGCPHRDVQPEETIVVPQASQSEEVFPKAAPAYSSSATDEGTDIRVSDPQLKRVLLPKTIHGRARRLLQPDSTDLPLVAVTMRGDCHFIERKKKYRITGYSLPNPGVFRHVSDVCMVGNTAILGCDKGTNQISFLSVTGKPEMVNVACSPHSNGPRYQETQRRGVTCLAAIHAKDGHIKFLSGGYDGTVHMWMADTEKLHEPRFEKVVSYGACVMALAYRDRDRSVVASAQKTLRITDLNRQRSRDYAFSNDIQQIHIHPQASYVTLLEVRHLDHQIQLYDSRKANFDREPCLSFGYRNTNSKFPATHTRGSVHLVHFAKASEDGCVLLWDFRNSKRAMVFQQAENVVHTIFADRDIATFGQGVVTFFEDYLA